MTNLMCFSGTSDMMTMVLTLVYITLLSIILNSSLSSNYVMVSMFCF